MSYNNLSFSVGEVLTAAKMNNLQGNFAGFANKDTTPDVAPVLANDYIVSAMIATNQVVSDAIAPGSVGQSELSATCVGQGELKTSWNTVSTTSGIPTYLSAVTRYSFFPALFHTTTAGDARWRLYDTANFDMTYNPTVGSWGYALSVREVGTGTGYIGYMSITASPPYDLGDGEVPLFINLSIDKNSGEVVAVSICEDPAWAYLNDNAIADVYDKEGKAYKYIKDIPNEYAEIDIQALIQDQSEKNTAKLKDYIEMVNQSETKLKQITNDEKNKFMDILPSNIDVASSNKNGREIVLLDPVCDLTWKLAELAKQGGVTEIHEMFHKGYMNIDHVQIVRTGPKTIRTVSYDWK